MSRRAAKNRQIRLSLARVAPTEHACVNCDFLPRSRYCNICAAPGQTKRCRNAHTNASFPADIVASLRAERAAEDERLTSTTRTRRASTLLVPQALPDLASYGEEAPVNVGGRKSAKNRPLAPSSPPGRQATLASQKKAAEQEHRIAALQAQLTAAQSGSAVLQPRILQRESIPRPGGGGTRQYPEWFVAMALILLSKGLSAGACCTSLWAFQRTFLPHTAGEHFEIPGLLGHGSNLASLNALEDSRLSPVADRQGMIGGTGCAASWRP